MLGAALHIIMYKATTAINTAQIANITPHSGSITFSKLESTKDSNHTLWKKTTHNTKECIQRQHFADTKFAWKKRYE